MLKRISTLLVVGALMFTMGCSDDGDPVSTDDTSDATDAPDETTTTEAPEVALADWIEQADEICADGEDALEELGEPADMAEVVEMLPDALDIQRDQLEALTELGLPDEEADAVEEALGLINDRIELVEQALDDIEDGADAEEVFTELDAEGQQIDDDLDELSQDVGLEVCGVDTSNSGPDPSTPDNTAISGDPFTYGDDPGLDALWEECDGGDPDACDTLWSESPSGSDYETFGFSCGGRVPEDEVAVCSEVMGGSPTSGEPDTYGDDADLDALWDECDAGDGQACDDLFFQSPVDSEYEDFGRTCGGRLEGTEADTVYCVDAM